jgi:transcription initiation factor TFIIIB Brf1 subunit/transcription initiation factor TFIIB
VPVVLSMLATLVYTARMHRTPVPVQEIATSSVADRSTDIRFDDFMADELGVVTQVYDLAGEPLTD